MTTEKTCESCSDTTCQAKAQRPGEGEAERLERQALWSRMCQIKHKVLVLSGKGGVGKSTVAVNLAAALALAGRKVGLLDVDIHGPSVPQLLHIEDAQIIGGDDGLCPVEVELGTGTLNVMSIGFLLPGRDDAVIWRGPRKTDRLFNPHRTFRLALRWGGYQRLRAFLHTSSCLFRSLGHLLQAIPSPICRFFLRSTRWGAVPNASSRRQQRLEDARTGLPG